MRTDIEGVVPQAPGLQRGARHLEFFGGLTLGETLSSQLPVLLKEVGAFEAIPAWLATLVDFPIGGFNPPQGRLARGFKPLAFSRFLGCVPPFTSLVTQPVAGLSLENPQRPRRGTLSPGRSECSAVGLLQT